MYVLRVEHHRPHQERSDDFFVDIVFALDNRLELRIPVEEDLTVSVGKDPLRIGRNVSTGIDEDQREILQQRLVELGGLNAVQVLEDVGVTVEQKPAVDPAEAVAILYIDRIVARPAQDCHVAKELLQIDHVVAAAGDDRHGQFLVGIEFA